MNNKILITGGMKGGKSSYALQLAEQVEGERVYLATAQAFDEDMKRAIERHKKERTDQFTTIEEPIYLAKALQSIEDKSVIVIDCMTLWVNNLLFQFKEDQKSISEQLDLFVKALPDSKTHIIIVTNEVGLGIIPESQLSRDYIKLLGNLNKRLAQESTEVIMMVSGIPQWIKRKKREWSAAI